MNPSQSTHKPAAIPVPLQRTAAVAPSKQIVDRQKLEDKVKLMYRNVALNPMEHYHFEMGRTLAEKLGYSPNLLNAIPEQSIQSFAGVGYHFGLAQIKPGTKILDLGSGSGMDLFIASRLTGPTGQVVGIDMTLEQLNKSTLLTMTHQFMNVSLVKGHIEDLPFQNEEFDLVISNGVINLSADKEKVFSEISRVLKKGGRMAISDIVTERHLPEQISCNATLWAACIGGAAQEDDYLRLILSKGLHSIQAIHNTQYEFISKSAKGASLQYGVKSISICADKR